MSMKACGAHAAFRYTWPGKPEAVTCIEHAAQLQGVASAMGFPLQFIPIGYRVGDAMPTEFPVCTQQVPCSSDEESTTK